MGTKKQKTRPKLSEEDSLLKHYPWLKEFDQEAKSHLIATDVTNVHILKLITLLESNVSSEVTRLRTKPNRATKLLTQIRRRIGMTKVGGYLIGSSEQELFPTYGLLMNHIIDITLVSSKIEKYGAQQVASELYYFLKLIFHGGNEYILDVILCSTLDEHASTRHKVGFQLFSFVVEDWRFYCDTHSGMMKYCAVASVLAESSPEGRVFVERNLPVEIDKTFCKYLSKTLAIDLSAYKMNKTLTMFAAVQAIRANVVKPMCRSRLVIVSKRDILKSLPTDHNHEDADDSDAESTTSTVLNVNVPSSSTSNGNCIVIEKVLGDLGMIDTTGNEADPSISRESDSDDERNNGILMETNEESRTSVGDVNIKQEVLYVADVDAVAGDFGFAFPEPDQTVVTSTGVEDEIDIEVEEPDEAQRMNLPAEQIPREAEDGDADSDLEILSEKEYEQISDDDGSGSRDEAEAESGEDEVPNYDEDSDLEEEYYEEEEVEHTMIANDSFESKGQMEERKAETSDHENDSSSNKSDNASGGTASLNADENRYQPEDLQSAPDTDLRNDYGDAESKAAGSDNDKDGDDGNDSILGEVTTKTVETTRKRISLRDLEGSNAASLKRKRTPIKDEESTSQEESSQGEGEESEEEYNLNVSRGSKRGRGRGGTNSTSRRTSSSSKKSPAAPRRITRQLAAKRVASNETEKSASERKPVEESPASTSTRGRGRGRGRASTSSKSR